MFSQKIILKKLKSSDKTLPILKLQLSDKHMCHLQTVVGIILIRTLELIYLDTYLHLLEQNLKEPYF